MKCLTVRQPWAWLIVNGHKPVENRDWASSYRGPLAIHASKGMTRAEYEDAVEFVRSFTPDLADSIPPRVDLVCGAVLGTVEMTGCVTAHPSPFFQGRYGFVFEHARLLKMSIPARGALGLWDWKANT